jgi:PD-(D/E)XK nuclease family transposase
VQQLLEGQPMPSGIDPRVDYVFKRLFGSENTTALLIDLLNAVLQFVVGKRVRDVILRNPFSAKAYAEFSDPGTTNTACCCARTRNCTSSSCPASP